MLRRLRIKLICINMVFLMGMLCVILGLVVHFTRSNLEAESLRMMQTVAARPFDAKRPNRLCFAVRPTREGGLTAEGSSFYDLSDADFLAGLVGAVAASGEPSGVLEEYSLRWLMVSGPPELKCIVFADISGEQVTLAHLTRTCVLGGCLGFVAFLILNIFLTRWTVRPVERAWEQQRQFVADASHELKTPLTVIMTNAELLQDPGWGEGDRAKFSDSIVTMSRQMRSLVERLLELARSDSGQSAAAFEAVDLSTLAESALLPFEPLFFEKGLELSGRIEPGIIVWGSAEQLRQAADVLLDNAQKYSAPGGRVEVRLRRAGRRRCRLSVSGPGDALSKVECRDIFKRFYRADKARSRDGGFGLGLSIAQGIVERHHGRIWAESADGVNTFHVELPSKGSEASDV